MFQEEDQEVAGIHYPTQAENTVSTQFAAMGRYGPRSGRRVV
jgi:hypothetical protein